jgi:citrate synthase
MINGRLTSAEAAERLGVKSETLYAYVSRGLLPREKTARGSTFDPRDVARLAQSGRQGAARDSTEPTGGAPVFVTAVSLIEDGHLYYRGLDAARLSRQRSFEEVAGWLWEGAWPGPSGVPWSAPVGVMAAAEAAVAGAGFGARPLERFMVSVAAAGVADELRHDLSPAAVQVTGRGLVSVLVRALGGGTSASSIAQRVWSALSVLPVTPERVALLDAALVLSADHELAPSTMAARVAASFRADPYAVVLTGLGPASGSWYPGSSGAPSEVERLLEEAAEVGAERAVGERLRRGGSLPHGFGMPLYPDGDPRGAELLSRLDSVGGAVERHRVVDDVLSLAASRGFPPPNVDLGLGALSYCAGMPAESGQALATLGKVVGWLAHAMEEYTDPSRFRARGYYVGAKPDPAG